MNGMAFPGAATIRGVVFDLDGVLIQSRAAHAQAFQEVLATFGITDFNYDRFAGWRTSEVFRTVLSEHPPAPVTEETIAQCARRKSQRARELLGSGDHVAPDCVPVLEQLCTQYRVALASSGSQASVQAFLDRTGLRPAFRSVLTGDDVAQAKPDPEIFRRSMEALALRPENCVVIEDAVAGVRAARSAGAHAIGMTTEHPDELKAAGAACVVRSLGELAQLLA
jgi:HAD superfamily hydrolase (TIGR01509 family)